VTDAYIRRIAPAESGPAGTNWSRYTLDEIWDMVKTEDGRVTSTQVDAWRRMADLCRDSGRGKIRVGGHFGPGLRI
jgi:hypothetical protein